jgi:hypothetical protein
MSLVFVDDAVASDFQPFALTRPCCELRAGALLVRQRWEMAAGETTSGFIGGPHLADFDEPGAASFLSGTIPAGSILVNSRCAVGLGGLPQGDAWRCDGQLAAVRLRNPVTVDDVVQDGNLGAWLGGETPVDVQGRWFDQVWDLIRHLPDLLTADITTLAERIEQCAPRHDDRSAPGLCRTRRPDRTDGPV